MLERLLLPCVLWKLLQLLIVDRMQRSLCVRLGVYKKIQNSKNHFKNHQKTLSPNTTVFSSFQCQSHNVIEYWQHNPIIGLRLFQCWRLRNRWTRRYWWRWNWWGGRRRAWRYNLNLFRFPQTWSSIEIEIAPAKVVCLLIPQVPTTFGVLLHAIELLTGRRWQFAPLKFE